MNQSCFRYVIAVFPPRKKKLCLTERILDFQSLTVFIRLIKKTNMNPGILPTFFYLFLLLKVKNTL